MRAFNAELSKLFSLPGIWLAFLIGAFAPALISALDSLAQKEEIIAGVSTRLSEVGYIGLALGVQGVIILGVLAVSSEYLTESSESGGGQQITTSLTVVSSRIHFLLAKAGAVTVISILLCIVAIMTTVSATHLILGEYAPAFEWSRLIGAICYWTFTALLALGITFLTKNGILPLAVLIINSSVVSFSVLLYRVTKLAFYLPDRAGAEMFMFTDNTSTGSLFDRFHTPFTGGLVMFAWVVVVFIIAAIVFHRRDVAA
ncbi:ABC transporter permease [Paenibacillus odorifer]|uniref:ABC transporter permease n=1 Tax=Paenibacillus TaxID=44249 RepID=UPI00096EC37C|nr:ABC transporter permease [Paenibacillus odorifer]OMC70093.1 ABC transporter permease [Paenibacillus odorifer]OMD96686.1 ABC transporter permease [Paenibacillus odorifer]